MSGRVLLVEDNTDFVANLTEILTGLGYQVRAAGTCAQALREGRDWVEVALVDFRLPDGPATGLASQLKDENPDCEVVLLTGYATVESAAQAVRAGVWDFLVKPCPTPDVLATLAKAVRHVHAQAENRELSRRAQVAERLASVGTLTAGLSHEIRNPLNAAGLQLAVLERRVRKLETTSQASLLEPLLLVRDEIRRLENILRDFLQFARPAPAALHPLSLQALLVATVALLNEAAGKRAITLTLELPELPEVKGDADKLKQVFMNLVLNAIDASPDGGQVRVSAAPEPGFVRVSIEDSGTGVAPALRERIFEPFFSTRPQGSGLGLPICHAIVTQHSGAITLHDSALGGARFDVTLPRG